MKHLKEVEQSYFEHFGNAAYYSFRLFLGSIGLLIHACYPDILTDFGTNQCKLVLNSNKKKKLK